MDKTTLPEAGRATAAHLQLLAAHGVQRALAARMTELSSQQVGDVSGGASLYYDDFCGTGVRPLPKIGGGVLAGGVIVIINGKFPDPYQLGNLALTQQIQGF
jgi:hypothetical protein